jgi:hypothetical protein
MDKKMNRMMMTTNDFDFDCDPASDDDDDTTIDPEEIQGRNSSR